MKNLLLAFVLTFVSIAYSQNNYYVGFHAKEGIPGHAFISIGYEDPQQMMTVYDGTWGMYPKKSGKDAIGEVPGEIRDDFATKIDYTFVMTTTKNKYDEVKKILNKWKSKNYELTKSDCLSFVIEVSSIFEDKIKIPNRSGFHNFPDKYLKKLIDINK